MGSLSSYFVSNVQTNKFFLEIYIENTDEPIAFVEKKEKGNMN